MRQVAHLVQVRADGLLEAELADGLDEDEKLQEMAGYVLEQPSAFPVPGIVRVWGYLVVMTGAFGGPEVSMTVPVQAWLNGDKNPNPYQRQRLADQQWVFQAHQNHIHVAR